MIFLFLSIAGMTVKDGIIRNLVNISEVHLAEKKAFDEALNILQFDDYVTKDSVMATKGKNIIVIGMESVEAAYLQNDFKKLTPNLSSYATELSYYPIKQHEGGDYTIAAIYTWLTGIPMFFKQHGNNVFFNTLSLKLTSIIDALTKAGYHCEYLMGNAEFAGTKDMLELMGFTVKSEKNYDKKYASRHWGLHDKDLFEIARTQLNELYELKQPFAYFISTVSTHGPDGIFDERMAEIIPEQKSQLELMVAALDKHIGELVSQLEQDGKLENTALYILPDHLIYHIACRVLNDFVEPRDLFVITNSRPGSFDPEEYLLQIDIPKFILEGAEVRHNLNFLTDKIRGDKISYLDKHRKTILQLNESALVREKVPASANSNKALSNVHPDSIYIRAYAWSDENYGIESEVYTGTKKHKVKRGVNILLYADNDYTIENFDSWKDRSQIDRLLESLEILLENRSAFYVFVHDAAGDNFKEYASAFKNIGMPELGKLKDRKAYLAYSNHGYTSEYINGKRTFLKSTFHPYQSSRPLDKIIEQSMDPSRFIAHAGGEIEGHTYTNSLEAMDQAYDNGFRLFELDIIKTRDGHFVAEHDWKKWKNMTKYTGELPVDLQTFKSFKKLESLLLWICL